MSEEAKNIKLSCLAITVLTYIFFSSNEKGVRPQTLEEHFGINKERLPWCAFTLNSVLLKHPKCTDDGPMDSEKTFLKITAAVFELEKANLIVDDLLRYYPSCTYQELVDAIKNGAETCPKFYDHVEREFTFLGKKDRDYILQKKQTSMVDGVAEISAKFSHEDGNIADSPNETRGGPEAKLTSPKDQISLFQKCIEKHMQHW